MVHSVQEHDLADIGALGIDNVAFPVLPDECPLDARYPLDDEVLEDVHPIEKDFVRTLFRGDEDAFSSVLEVLLAHELAPDLLNDGLSGDHVAFKDRRVQTNLDPEILPTSDLGDLLKFCGLDHGGYLLRRLPARAELRLEMDDHDRGLWGFPGIHDLDEAGKTKGDVHFCHTRVVEGTHGHLGTWFSNGLGSHDAAGLGGVDLPPHEVLVCLGKHLLELGLLHPLRD